MQTIKVSIKKDGKSINFMLDGRIIGNISPDTGNYNRYAVRVSNVTDGEYNLRLPCAVEYVGDAICRHFEAFGLNVEFCLNN